MRVLIVLSALFFCVCTCISIPSPVKGVYVGWEEIRWNNVSGSIVKDPVDAGFNCIILSFFAPYSKDGFDAMEAWMGEDPGNKQSAINYAHSKGAVVLGTVRLSNSYGDPYSQNATALGIQFANWAVQQLLDGLDLNFQDINSGFTVNDKINLTQWAIDVITAVRATLGSNYIVTIAAPPLSFGPAGYSDTYAGVSGGLLGVYKTVPTFVDYIFFWYFLQPAECVANYNIFFVTTSGTDCSPYTAVNELLTAGAPANKFVVAIADQTGDVTGYVDPTTFGAMIRSASTSLGWTTGIATWNWQGISFTSTWLTTVYATPVATTTTTAGSTTGLTTGSTITGGNTTTSSSSTSSTSGGVSTTTTTTSGSTTTTAHASTTTTTATGSTTTTTATGSTTTTTAKSTTTTTTAKSTTTTTTAKSTTATSTSNRATTSGTTASDAAHTTATVGCVTGVLLVCVLSLLM